ncbi:dihydrolipoyl dehydrogenase [Blastopirellula sp. J2-11]|uniref:dihydrolipoyl dehydrogenase n=1 Tax=Blastopirellula sp. J2-11 TaxID=2943192 RepID=UPI0021C7DF59|nr:dihydrolipoyl dehydrogenase [Blastopirellula sp. J2-11]UUO05505.1 dihydrolipoyl dehydrogenase [Blastopirellula sp. J2-11]
MSHTQLAVLGGGPGGYAAAFLAADHGMEVTLIEQEPKLGGTCLLRGCIPSKALLHVAKVIDETYDLHDEWGVSFGAPQIDLDKLRARKNKVIDSMSGGLKQLAKRRNVTIIQARGTFLDSGTLELTGDSPSIPEGGKLTFDHCVIATGSVAAVPPAFQVDSDRVMDSTGALELKEVPETMLVIGGGYIGLEMGSVYAQLGTQVSVVELTDGLLPGADRNLVKPLQKRIEGLFEGRLHLNTKVGSIGIRGDKVEVAFEGPAKFGTEQYDRVLVSIGRWPNTKGIGLENTKVVVNKRGFIEVDSQLKTGDPKLLAIGDVTGDPMLAHKATHEGRTAIEALLGHPVEFKPAAIPAVIFTDPEIAWAGLMEEAAKKEGREVEVVMYPWAASGRAQSLGRSDGMTKWIVDPTTKVVLGCGIVGPGAGELIGEAVLAIEMRAEVGDIASAIHPHPTLSETVMNAAEVFFGTATEIYKPKR